MPEAQDLLARGVVWLNGHAGYINALSYVNYKDQDGIPLCLQQHSMSELWEPGNDFLRMAVRCWSEAGGCIEHTAFKPIRFYSVIYRRIGGNWIYSELGPRSSYASWFGWEKARSSVGKVLEKEPGGEFYDRLISKPFKDVKTTGGMRIDHIYSHIPREPGGTPVPISYKRLLLGCHFPDKSPALVVIIDRRNDIDVPIVESADFRPMPKTLCMAMAA